MNRVAVCAGMVTIVSSMATAYAADPDATTVAQPPAAAASVSAAASAPKTALSTLPACGDALEFFLTNCPLTWYGVTLYGTVDIGADWQSHGVPFNASLVTGLQYLLQKNSNRAGFHPAPNGLSQSNIGVKGDEEILPDWRIVFDLNAGFDPYSMRLADGPSSLRENAGSAARRPERSFRFKPRRRILQLGRLCWRQFSDLRRPHPVPTELAHARRCPRL